jgi:hypothetical protein
VVESGWKGTRKEVCVCVCVCKHEVVKEVKRSVPCFLVEEEAEGGVCVCVCVCRYEYNA